MLGRLVYARTSWVRDVAYFRFSNSNLSLYFFFTLIRPPTHTPKKKSLKAFRSQIKLGIREKKMSFSILDVDGGQTAAKETEMEGQGHAQVPLSCSSVPRASCLICSG